MASACSGQSSMGFYCHNLGASVVAGMRERLREIREDEAESEGDGEENKISAAWLWEEEEMRE